MTNDTVPGIIIKSDSVPIYRNSIARSCLTGHCYIAVDYNRKGLDKLAERIKDESLRMIETDLLSQPLPEASGDLVMSFGLIEHFNSADTARMIKTHFDLLSDNGYCLITFPTPTVLYRIIRNISEIAGVWIFHDERAKCLSPWD